MSGIHTDQDGSYVLTNRVLYKISNKKSSIIGQNLRVPAPADFIIDRGGVIWIGSDGGGIVKLIPVVKKFHTVTRQDSASNGFLISSVRTFLKVNKNLFVGGYIRMQEVKNFNSDSTNYWKNLKTFDHRNPYAMQRDPVDANILWVGTEGNGLYRYNLKTAHYKQFRANIPSGKYHFLSNTIFDILVTRNKDIYFATKNGVSRWNHLTRNFSDFIHNDSNQNSLSPGYVIALCEDKNGNFWMGTDRSGISIYNPKTNTFQKLLNQNGSNGKNTLSNNRVNVIFNDSHNNIWVGTASGLNKYSFVDDGFTVYKAQAGLPNDCIYGILEDETGCFWLSTNKGISKFNPGKETFANYDAGLGLQSDEFNTAAYYQAPDGEMFFGGIKGFTSFYPKQILANNYAPQVVITNFRKFNRPADLDTNVSYIRKIELPYNDYFFSFDFIMPEYSNPLHQKFSYKLSGLTNQWITLTHGEKTASFTAVPPGKYVLEVKGANGDGVWSEKTTKLNIVIHPAYWETWWFRTLALVIIFGTLFLLYFFRVRRLKKEKEIQSDLTKKLINSQEDERKNISHELHDDLGQNLLVVKSKLLLAERDNNFEDKLGDIIGILDGSIQDVSNISHLLHPTELDELGLSQAIESMVFRIKSASNLRITNMLPELDSYFSSEEKINIFRIIQEALNNILKHAQATKVTLSGEIQNHHLIILISDNGKGFIVSESVEKKSRPHMGLKGMKERALMAGGLFTVYSSPNKGTMVKIEFKNKKTND